MMTDRNAAYRSMDDAKYRAICLGWTIQTVEAA